MNSDSGNQVTLTIAVANADRHLLLTLLKSAHVSVGHWNGRLISVPGYSGHMTFSNFLTRVEALYQGIVKTIQQRQKKYEEDVTSKIQLMPFKGRGSLIPNLIFFPMNAALKKSDEERRWDRTPYPEANLTEENEVTDMLKWREEIDTEFDRLIKNSQKKIEHNAKSSCSWTIIKLWDSYLDTKKACQSTHKNDKKILAEMIATRNKRAVLEPLVKVADEVLPVQIAPLGRAFMRLDRYSNSRPTMVTSIGNAMLELNKYRTPDEHAE